MAEEGARDAKLVQYLTEAYGKEKELETSLAAHISMTDRPPYKKRLQQHLKETKNHAKLVERRIKKIGGRGTSVTETLTELASRAMATAKGPMHMIRGTGEEEKLLKNAKTEYSEEAEEIATYTAIETLAEEVGDRETAKIARQIRREEERMAKFLERQIPTLTKAVVRAEVPASERNGGRRRTSSRRAASTRSGSTASRSKASRARSKSGASRSGGSRAKASSSSRGKGSSSSRSKRGGSRGGGRARSRS